jgi:aerotaxis receptor
MDELFFSTTDPHGRIVTGNQVFARVAGYALEDLVGRAHSVVRHPDMPRVVFRILWDHLLAGESIAAYVKNLTSDGRPYWVVATASPVDGGYLSVRFKPSGPHFRVVQDLYAGLRAAEREVEEAGGSKNDAIAHSSALLAQALEGLGLPDYDAFMRTFLPAELHSREGLLEGSPYWDRMWDARPSADGGRGGCDPALLDAFRAVYRGMRRLCDRLEAYDALRTALGNRSRDLTGDTRLLSLNALMGANRLGPAGAALAVVAGLIGVEADRTAVVTDRLDTLTDDLGGLLARQTFEVSVGRLQAETAVFFALEALAGGHDAAAEVRVLGDALRRRVESVAGVSASLDGGLAAMAAQVTTVRNLLRTLEVLQLNGRVEASRLEEGAAVRHLFAEMGRRLEGVRGEIDRLVSVARTAIEAGTAGEVASAGAAVRAVDAHLEGLPLAA